MKNLEPQQLTAVLRPLQIIIGAMFAGAAAFSILALALSPEDAREGTPVITYVATGFAVIMLIVRFILPSFIVGCGLALIARGEQGEATTALHGTLAEAEPEVRQLCNLYATLRVLRAAMVEGACLLAVLAYFLEQSLLALAVAVVLLLILATELPTRNGLLHWLDTHLNRIEAARTCART